MLALTSLFADPLTIFLIGLALMILFFWYFATEIERKKRNIGSVLTLGICALCFAAASPPKEKLKGGIDILGGSSFSLTIQPRMDAEDNPMPITKEQVEEAIRVIEKRLNGMGTSEPLIARQGEDGILVQMPGVEPEESANIRATLEKVAKLELRQVSPRSEEPDDTGKSLAQRILDGDVLEPGYRAYILKGKDEDGNEYQRPILLNRRAALGGSDIAFATPSPQQADAVAITLNGDGTDKMIALTKDMQPQQDRIAIVLDGEVISAPVVNQVPLGKNFIIEGLREPGEVQGLANALMNPLENPLVVGEFRSVSPTLGKAVVEQGLFSGVISLLGTFLFALIYYRLAGFVAVIGLLVNCIIVFGVMAMFGFTFSLPGIAGIVLTIGVAVDANVLIYERLREEMDAGKSLKNALDAAYEKAFSAIFDANITSLITAVILFWMASGTIKGFAVTLTIGLLASMFSSILVTRVMFRWGIDLGVLKKMSFLHLIKSANFDFLGKAKISAIFSTCMILMAVSAAFIKKDSALGIDFVGGTRIQFQLGDGKHIPIDEINEALASVPLTKAAYPQEETNATTGTMITVRCATPDSALVIDALRSSIPMLGELAPGSAPDDKNYAIDASTEEVSALVGSTFLRESLIALGVGLIGIFLYIMMRFEFSFALGAMVALLHDVIIATGIVVLCGVELSLIHVGAILTVAGYSINDTIVVFDRIRESLLVRHGSIRQIINESINITLSRTILTSATVILVVGVMAVFGGAALRDFSVLILVGVVIGTYSSIFVASMVVVRWSGRKGGDLRSTVRATQIAEETAAAAP